MGLRQEHKLLPGRCAGSEMCALTIHWRTQSCEETTVETCLSKCCRNINLCSEHVFVLARCPQAVKLAVVYLSSSLVLAFAFLSPGPACFGSDSALVPQRYTSQINILYDGNIVWVCVIKLASTEMKQAGTECTATSLSFSPSFCPTATTLNQFVSIPNEQQRCWDLNSINKWTSKQTSTRPTPL